VPVERCGWRACCWHVTVYVPWHAYPKGNPAFKQIMEFQNDQLYHIYNRGVNKQQIFFKPANYIFFLKKVRKFILPFCEILNYTLMPNHFHFQHLKFSVNKQVFGKKELLSEGIRNLLSSYAQAINKQEGRTGSLFTQNTKAKCISEGGIGYATTCFHYIHQNAYKSNLVTRMEDWEYSSFKDYIGLRQGTLCNKDLAFEILELNKETFYEDSYRVIDWFDFSMMS
jgi:putative transposase